MSTITLPNIRVSSDLEIGLKLKDGGVAIDWSTLSNIKVTIYSDRQRSIAGRCDISIDEDDATVLVCRYASTKMQYLGVNRVIVQCTYMGETKTYDKPALNFVRWTDDQAGQEITISDPDIDVEITVEDVSSSILQEAVEAAFSAAERAEEAAEAAEHMVDIHTGPAGKSPYIGENGNWFEWDETTHQYVDTEEKAKGDTGETPDISIGTVTTAEPGTPAAATMTGTPEAPVLNLTIPKGVAGDTPNFTVGEVTTGQPGTPVIVTITGTAAAPVLNVTIPQGLQGNTGSSVDYPYELVNNLTTNDATKGLSAAQGKALKDEIDQLDLKVTPLSLPKNGNFAKREGDYSAIQPFSFQDTSKYGTSTSYYHADMLVFPGESVVVKANGSYSARFAFVSNLDCPYTGATYGLVTNGFYQINAGTKISVTVPSGAVAMKVYLGQLSGGDYTNKPESLVIYRPKNLAIVPQKIQMDKYLISGSVTNYNSSGKGYCFPIIAGRTYNIKVTSAGTSTKYLKLIASLPYRDRNTSTDLTGTTDFSTSNAILSILAPQDGFLTIFRNASLTVTIDEADLATVDDADVNATAMVQNYVPVDITNLTHLGFYIASANGLWKSSSSVKCVLVPVTPGKLLKLIPASSYNTIVYWMASDTAPVDGGVPDLVTGHLERMVFTKANNPVVILRVPEGANFAYVYTGAMDTYTPVLFGVAEPYSAQDGQENEAILDRCAYNDKRIIISEGRNYYFDDTYTNEVSYVDTSYLDQKIAEVPDGKHFIFLTDSHIDYTNFIGKAQNETPIVKYVRDRLGIRNVIFGGDAIGVQPTKYRGAKVLSIYAKEKFEAFGGDFLWVMGNHDANPFIPDGGTIGDALIDDEAIYDRTSKFMENYGIAVFPEKLINIINTSNDLLDNSGNVISDAEKRAFNAWAKLNYYYDDNKQKIRYIVLETGDAGYTLRNIFNTKTDGQYSLAVVAQFFVDSLKSVPNGYDVVVVGHEIVNAGGFWNLVFYKVLAAYKNKQSVSVDFRINNDTGHPAVSPIVRRTFDSSSLNGLTVDMSNNVGSGRVLVLSGHTHYDIAQIKKYVSDSDAIDVSNFPLSTSETPQSMTYEDNSILHIRCDRCCATQRSSSNWENITGAYSYPNQGTGEGDVQRLGNVTEVLFDVVTITADNRVVLTRFGAHGPVEGDKYVRDYVMPVPSA